MKSQIETFTNEMFGSIRSITVNDEIWFVAKDIADVLEYSDTYAMTRRLLQSDVINSNSSNSNRRENGSKSEKSENLPQDRCHGGLESNNSSNSQDLSNLSNSAQNRREDGFELPNLLNGRTGTTYINEPGLYQAILGSKKEEALRFRDWVTHEVLPSIRKTGSYSVYNNEDLTKISGDLLKAVSIVNTRVGNIESDVSQLKSEVQLIKNSISDKVHIPTDQLDLKGKCISLFKQYLEIDNCGEEALTTWLYKGYGGVIGRNILLQARRKFIDPLDVLSSINELDRFYNWAVKYMNQYLDSINKVQIKVN